MPILDAKNLRKAYGAKAVLDGAAVTIRTGERVGVVGLNGAGKSTLARILAGLEAPDSGEVTRRRGASVAYLDQNPRFDGNPTALEAVTAGLGAWHRAAELHAQLSRKLAQLGNAAPQLVAEQAAAAEEVERLGGWQQKHRAEAMLEQLGVTALDQQVSTLSGGEQRRIALAQVLVAAPSLAILDEPTNHLDAITIDWLEGYLQNDYPGALLLVTHDRYLLNRVARRTLEVSDGQVFSYPGGYELYLEQKAERLAHLERTEKNRQNFLRTELEWLRRQPKARGTKQKARTDRAQQALSQKATATDKSFQFSIEVARQGKTLLEFDHLSLGLGDKNLVSDLSFTLCQGERIGIVGRNGSGKTTLLRAILGQVPPIGGSVRVGQTARIAYFDQQRADLEPEKSVFDNVVGDLSKIELGVGTLEPYSYLERFGFSGRESRQSVGSLSGGERARVALARLLRSKANLILLDEPTNDLDVASLAALEDLLLTYSLSALVVTHDRWFLDRVATGILAFMDDGRVVRYSGNYQAVRAQQLAEKTHNATTKRATDPSGRNRQKKALTWSEERELEGMVERIDQAESKVAVLAEQLARPETYQQPPAEIAALNDELSAARNEVETLSARWEELETKKQHAETDG